MSVADLVYSATETPLTVLAHERNAAAAARDRACR